MLPILGILWALSPIILINFPAELVSNGLPKWPPKEEFTPKKDVDAPAWVPRWLRWLLWVNHWSKNALAAAVKVDWGFWGQFLAFVFWISHIGLIIWRIAA